MHPISVEILFWKWFHCRFLQAWFDPALDYRTLNGDTMYGKKTYGDYWVWYVKYLKTTSNRTKFRPLAFLQAWFDPDFEYSTSNGRIM